MTQPPPESAGHMGADRMPRRDEVVGRVQSPSLRQGRKVGRTLYVQHGYQPSDKDFLIGVVDSPSIAAVICAAVNSDSDMRGRLREALT